MTKSFPSVAASDSTVEICPLQDPSQPAPAPQLACNALTRVLLRIMAVACLVMAIVGVIVPGLPTTVFVLLAAWAAARSSPRLHRWLWQHRLFGSMLQNWAAGGCVSRRAKWSATAMMVVCAAILLLLPNAPRWATILACLCMACVLTWLWLRPEPKREKLV